MHSHQLLDHPLFDERPIRHVLAPFGFEVSIETAEPPIDHAQDDPEAIDAYASDPEAYIDSLTFQHPAGFTEICREENDEGYIMSVAVLAKTIFAQQLLCADSAFAGDNSQISASYIDVWKERMRQLSTEGWSREHDDGHRHGELAYAAAAYAYVSSGIVDGSHKRPAIWPWADKWWKPSADPRRNLVKAGALILAEIERLDRAEHRQGGEA